MKRILFVGSLLLLSSGCVVVGGYRSGGGWFLWPGSLGALVIVVILVLYFARAVLIPGGRIGVWFIAGLGFLIVVVCMLVSIVPPGDSANKILFEIKLVIGSIGTISLGLILYQRGVRAKKIERSTT